MREGEKRRGPSAHSPSPRAQHPNPRSRTHGRPRRPPGRDGKNGWLLFKNLKPRAEGSEMEIFTKFTFRYSVNRLACMRKPQTFYTLTVRVIARDKASTRRLTMAIFHGTSPRGEQCSADAVAEVRMDESTIENWARKTSNRRASMAASWRQRNLRSRWRVRQYKLTTWVCQGRLSAPSANELAWFYTGFRQSGTPGAFPKREKLTQRWVNLWQRTHAIIYLVLTWIIYFTLKMFTCSPQEKIILEFIKMTPF